MRRTSFNDGWSFRPQAVDRFAELMDPGAGLTPVTLPHDAVIGTDRAPEDPVTTRRCRPDAVRGRGR